MKWYQDKQNQQHIKRALLLLLVWFYMSILVSLFGVLIVAQFAHVLLTKVANEPLVKVATLISQHLTEILQFLSFQKKTLPYPFEDLLSK